MINVGMLSLSCGTTNACEFNETRVQDDYSVISRKFFDFLSTLLMFKLLKVFDKEELLESYTYKKMISILTRAKKPCIEEDDWKKVRINSS